MCIMYIHLELVAKDALRLHSMLAYLQSYMDNSSKVFMYSTAHMSIFGAPHLKDGAWYLDCRLGFTPPREEALFSSLSSTALVEAVASKEEAVQPAQVVKPKRAQGKKAKDGTSSELATHSTALVVTYLATKAAIEAFAAPICTDVGSMSTLPSMVLAVAS